MFGKHKLDRPIAEHEHVMGAPTAAVSLVAYVDYECPYSAKLFSVLEAVHLHMQSQVRIALRHFPLDKHPHSQLAAELSEAAAEQSRFWEMSALLFEHQKHLDRRDLYRLAHELRLDVKKVERQLESGEFRSKVLEHRKAGKDSGVHETPTVFINGKRYDGAKELRPLVNALEEAGRNAPRSYADLEEHPFIGS